MLMTKHWHTILHLYYVRVRPPLSQFVHLSVTQDLFTLQHGRDFIILHLLEIHWAIAAADHSL